MNYTWEDSDSGLCPPHMVGLPKPNEAPLVPPTNSGALVQIYLDVFNEIGGKKSLVAFAKDNPMKFYDQLLKLLVAMEAPQQAQVVQMNFGPMSNADLEVLSTNDLKRRLLQGATYEAEP